MNEFEKYQSTLANEDLVRIAFFERGKMKKEARKSALKLIQQRKISNEDLQLLKSKIRTNKRQESKDKLREKNNKYGFFNYLFDLILHG